MYEVGGPNSIRAFQPRAVGPGTLPPSNQTFFFTGKGDILIEGNLEWRPKITDLFELGLFFDAGNVWLFKGGLRDSDLATFDFNDFYKELAIGMGIGIRLNFDIMLLRFDFSIPLAKPWLPEGNRWVVDEIALGSRSWRRENLLFQFNFGYSF